MWDKRVHRMSRTNGATSVIVYICAGINMCWNTSAVFCASTADVCAFPSPFSKQTQLLEPNSYLRLRLHFIRLTVLLLKSGYNLLDTYQE